jgi:hypothetical protein
LVFGLMGIRNIQGLVPQDRHGFIQKNVLIELISFIALIVGQTPFRSRCEKCRGYHGFRRSISNNIPKLLCPNLLSNSCLHHTVPGHQRGVRRGNGPANQKSHPSTRKHSACHPSFDSNNPERPIVVNLLIVVPEVRLGLAAETKHR